MNENLNLVEILKDAPKGTKLWSPICGECYFQRIDEGSCPPIVCTAMLVNGNYCIIYFTEKGIYFNKFADGGCTLFPSRENHDWSTFKAPKKHKEFKPFQKVLRVDKKPMRVTGPWIKVWSCDIYNFYDEGTHIHYFVSGYSAKDDEVIPYTGNEDKLGEKVK